MRLFDFYCLVWPLMEERSQLMWIGRWWTGSLIIFVQTWSRNLIGLKWRVSESPRKISKSHKAKRWCLSQTPSPISPQKDVSKKTTNFMLKVKAMISGRRDVHRLRDMKMEKKRKVRFALHWAKRVAFKDLTIIRMQNNWILNNKTVLSYSL